MCLQVYEVTIIEAEDEDSFDEDTEITEAVSLDTNGQKPNTRCLNEPEPDCVCFSGLLAVSQV